MKDPIGPLKDSVLSSLEGIIAIKGWLNDPKGSLTDPNEQGCLRDP